MDILATRVAQVLGVGPAQVATLDTSDDDAFSVEWFTDADQVAIQISPLRGDFPLMVEMTTRSETDVEPFLLALSSAMGVVIVTDEIGVNSMSDSQWMLITPDGSLVQVLADADEFGDEDPAIILQPEFRKVYETNRIHAAAD
jgi:hypothetical protein